MSAKDSAETTAPRSWRTILKSYQKAHTGRSVVELILSAAPLALIWAAAWAAMVYGYWPVALALTIPAGGFMVRMFMIQHDCGHHAFFSAPAANDWTGRAIGVLTLTPYDCWRKTHAVHHATSGNLDRRGLGGVITLTVAEYAAMSWWRRLGYRFYRHPLVMFGLGPAYLFFIEQRLPIGVMREGWRPWVSAMGTNLCALILAAGIVWLGGWNVLLIVFAPTLLIAASIGVWLFYVQHQFEESHWARGEDWDATHAALEGSSHYDLPAPLRWITGNIGVHHVHHVASRIPFYRLQKVLADHPELKDVSRLTFVQSLRCIGLGLWDEAERRLVTFRAARRAGRAALTA